MKKFYSLMLFLALSALTGYSAEKEITIETSLPYGSSFSFWPTQVNIDDKVSVDWGDGEIKSYTVNPNGWGDAKKVQGKLLGSTIHVYCNLQKLDIENSSVTGLKFVEQDEFKTLLAAHNSLTNDGLDLSGAPNIVFLDLSYNNMLNLNLSSMTSLENFNVKSNPEFNTCIFPDGCESLKTIDMSDCDIVHFYPVLLPNLSSLNLANGSLMDLEIEDNYPSLSSLNVSNNYYIESLNVTKLSKLYTLIADHTKISEINVSQSPQLNTLNVSHTNVSKLYLEENKELVTLNCSNTNISKLNVKGLTKISTINVDSTNISRLDLSDKPLLRYVNARATNIQFLDLHSGIGYNLLKTLDIRDCKQMTPQSLNFTYETMPFHTGSSWSNNVLLAGSNAETSNTSLIPYESDNFFLVDTEGDGSASMDSITISLVANDYGTISLTQEGNSTTNFEFSPIAGTAMPGYPIQVVASPVDGYVYSGVEVNGKFYEDSIFVVSENATIKPLFKQDNSNLSITLGAKVGTPQQYFLAADNENTEITVDWGDSEPVKYVIGTAPTVVETEGTSGDYIKISGPVTYADFSSYPMMYDNLITSIDLSHNPYLKSLTTYMNEIETLDVSNLTDLEDLDCSYCELDELNIGNNLKLKSLLAYGNYLEEIDLTTAPMLEYLDVKNNNLRQLNLSNNDKLIKLVAQNNALSEVNVSSMKNLEILSVGGNIISNIDVTNCPYLYELNASNNKLSEIDLSKNPYLETVMLDGNQLTGLDLSAQEYVNMINVSSNGWDACTLNDFYYSLPEYVAPTVADPSTMSQTRLWVQGNTTSSGTPNEADFAESIIATGKGWTLNIEGDGSGCDMAYITILPYENGTVTVMDSDLNTVKSGDKVKKNSEITITANPDANHFTQFVKVNGVEVTDGKCVITRSSDILVKFQAPNGIESPNADNIKIESRKGQIIVKYDGLASLDVYDVNGVKLYTDQIDGTTTINIPSGIYVVKVNSTVKKLKVD